MSSSPQALRAARETILYRFYDTLGQLLYVGITLDPAERFSAHAYSAPWWDRAVRITLERFATRFEASTAETVAINAEAPAYNRLGSTTPAPATQTWPNAEARREYIRSQYFIEGLSTVAIRNSLGVARETIFSALRSDPRWDLRRAATPKGQVRLNTATVAGLQRFAPDVIALGGWGPAIVALLDAAESLDTAPSPMSILGRVVNRDPPGHRASLSPVDIQRLLAFRVPATRAIGHFASTTAIVQFLLLRVGEPQAESLAPADWISMGRVIAIESVLALTGSPMTPQAVATALHSHGRTDRPDEVKTSLYWLKGQGRAVRPFRAHWQIAEPARAILSLSPPDP